MTKEEIALDLFKCINHTTVLRDVLYQSQTDTSLGEAVALVYNDILRTLSTASPE